MWGGADKEEHEARTALPFYALSLAMAEDEFGNDHRQVARALIPLATAHLKIGEPRKAKELLERALCINERATNWSILTPRP